MKNNNTNLELIALGVTGNLKAIGSETKLLAASPNINVLTIPASASLARITLEADDITLATDITRLVRYWYNNKNTPTSTTGIPMGHLDEIVVGGAHNMGSFKMLVIDSGTASLTLQVQYYKL